MQGRFFILLFLLTQLPAKEESSIKFDLGAELGVDYWFFPEMSKDQHITSIFGEIELEAKLGKSWEIKILPRALYDIENENRSRYKWPILEDLYVNFFKSNFEIRAGYQIFSWKTVESVSPADFLNQTDLEEDLLDAKKVGELAIRTRVIIPWEKEFILEAYYFPMFTPARLPRQGNKYVFRRGIDISNAMDNHRYTSSFVEGLPQFALRVQPSIIDAFDISMFYFFGYDRFPAVMPMGAMTPENMGNPYNHRYHRIMNTGFTFQGEVGDWLWKGEGVFKLGLDDVLDPESIQQGPPGFTEINPYFSYTLGFEYTLYGLLFDDHDLGFIWEFIGDTEMLEDRETLPGFRLFGSHVFSGLRYTFNNINDRALLIGGMYNYLVTIEDSQIEMFYQLEYEERVMKHLKIKARFSDIIATDSESILSRFENNMRTDLEAVISF